MLCEIKIATTSKDSAIQRRGLAVELVCLIKSCAPDYAEKYLRDCIEQFAQEEAPYLVGRIHGVHLARLQVSKAELEKFLRSISWYAEQNHPQHETALREAYCEALGFLEKANREIARYQGEPEKAGKQVTK